MTGSLADLLGDDGEGWRARAACTDLPLVWFFPVRGGGGPGHHRGGSGSANQARVVCAGCPVQAHCLEFALVNQIRWGIWGGTTEKDRRVLQRARREATSGLHAVEDPPRCCEDCAGLAHRLRSWTARSVAA